MLNSKQLEVMLQKEIDWYKGNLESPHGPSKEFRVGFIAGLRAAHRLLTESPCTATGERTDGQRDSDS